jgi:hypothetical protein
LKRPLVIAVFCLLFAADLLAQSRNRRRPTAASTEQAIVDIRQIDFENFTYTLDAKSYKLRDGYYAETTASGTQWELGMVDGPYYGDLTGDGKDEVAFVLSYGAAQSPNAAEARVYTLQNGRAVLLATFKVADSINCRLDHYLEVYNGMITIERIYATGTRCDYNETIQYRWSANRFTPIGAAKRMACRCM